MVCVYLEEMLWKAERAEKTLSECNMNSPLTTVNTVCGRSREIANPNALRYLFSWSRLESSCSLENRARELNIWINKKKNNGFGNNGVQRFNAKWIPLGGECLNALTVQIISLAQPRAPWTIRCWLKHEEIKVGFSSLMWLNLVVYKHEINPLSSW